MNGQQVVMVFPASHRQPHLPGGPGPFLNDFYREKGVEVLAGAPSPAWRRGRASPS